MSSSTPLSSTTTPSILAIQISEKPTKNNYPLWSAQILPGIRAAQLEGLLTDDEKQLEKTLKASKADYSTDEESNLTYIAWVPRDQAVLGYLLALLTHETLMHVSWCKTTVEAWSVLAALYASQSHARLVTMSIALATMKQNHLSVSNYYAKMCNYADELAASGATLHDDELVAYLLTGLSEDYNPVFTAVLTRIDPIKLADLYAQLLSFKQHTTLQGFSLSVGSSAMTASHERGYSTSGRGLGGPARGNGRGHRCGH
jgi:hypothetical protein